MDVLDADQIERFHRDGYLLLPDAISTDQLDGLALEFERWKDESRTHREPYGTTQDGRPRFDIEPGHSADHPALRRIASPIELSDAYLDVMRSNVALDAVAQLLGPNIKFNHCKINSKLPGAATEVKFHQDFLFEPHTNDDMITVLFFIDEVTTENGPLEVVPGSHRGPLHDHWHAGVFTGAVSPEIAALASPDAVPCHGPSGAACLMHGRVLHGSAPNLSSDPRTLFICTYSSEDSYPLQVNHVPSRFAGELVRGEPTNRVRCTSYEMEFPEVPTGASFFGQQEKATS